MVRVGPILCPWSKRPFVGNDFRSDTLPGQNPWTCAHQRGCVALAVVCSGFWTAAAIASWICVELRHHPLQTPTPQPPMIHKSQSNRYQDDKREILCRKSNRVSSGSKAGIWQRLGIGIGVCPQNWEHTQKFFFCSACE